MIDRRFRRHRLHENAGGFYYGLLNGPLITVQPSIKTTLEDAKVLETVKRPSLSHERGSVMIHAMLATSGRRALLQGPGDETVVRKVKSLTGTVS